MFGSPVDRDEPLAKVRFCKRKNRAHGVPRTSVQAIQGLVMSRGSTEDSNDLLMVVCCLVRVR